MTHSPLSTLVKQLWLSMWNISNHNTQLEVSCYDTTYHKQSCGKGRHIYTQLVKSRCTAKNCQMLSVHNSWIISIRAFGCSPYVDSKIIEMKYNCWLLCLVTATLIKKTLKNTV